MNVGELRRKLAGFAPETPVVVSGPGGNGFNPLSSCSHMKVVPTGSPLGEFEPRIVDSDPRKAIKAICLFG